MCINYTNKKWFTTSTQIVALETKLYLDYNSTSNFTFVKKNGSINKDFVKKHVLIVRVSRIFSEKNISSKKRWW